MRADVCVPANLIATSRLPVGTTTIAVPDRDVLSRLEATGNGCLLDSIAGTIHRTYESPALVARVESTTGPSRDLGDTCGIYLTAPAHITVTEHGTVAGGMENALLVCRGLAGVEDLGLTVLAELTAEAAATTLVNARPIGTAAARLDTGVAQALIYTTDIAATGADKCGANKMREIMAVVQDTIVTVAIIRGSITSLAKTQRSCIARYSQSMWLIKLSKIHSIFILLLLLFTSTEISSSFCDDANWVCLVTCLRFV